MKRITKIVAMLLLVAFALVGCTATPATSTGTETKTETAATTGNVIKLGMVMPLTGANAESGKACVQGAQIAVEEINAAGGIEMGGQKYTFEIITEDDQGIPAEAVSAAQKLLINDKVDMLFCSVLSSCGLAIMEICSDYPDVLFSTISCASDNFGKLISENTEKYFNFYKPYWNNGDYAGGTIDALQAFVESGEIKIDTKKVALIAEDTDFGRGFAETAKTMIPEKLGCELAAIEYIEAGVTDFYSIINKFKSIDPDIVISCTVALNSGVAYLKQSYELGTDWSEIGVSYVQKFGFTEQAGVAAEGVLCCPLSVDFVNNETHKAHGEKVLEYFPDAGVIELHIAAYDVLNMLFDAIEAAGTMNAKDGLAAAYGASEYHGMEGVYVFKPDHTAYCGAEYIPCPVAQVQDGVLYGVFPPFSATRDYIPQN